MKESAARSGMDVTLKMKMKNVQKLRQISLLVQIYIDNKKYCGI